MAEILEAIPPKKVPVGPGGNLEDLRRWAWKTENRSADAKAAETSKKGDSDMSGKRGEGIWDGEERECFFVLAYPVIRQF